MAPATHPHISPTRHGAGFTMIELLVVVSVIAILAGLLIPAVGILRDKAHMASDANLLRQVATAMFSYSADNYSQFPAVYVQVDGSLGDKDSADPRATAVASLELLAFESPGQVTNELFRSRANPLFHPRVAATDVLTQQSSAWAAGIQSDEANLPFMAYDWSVPANAGSARVILASRGSQLHKGQVIMAHADGHVSNVQAERNTPSTDGTGQTQDIILGTAAWVTIPEAIVQDSTPDNIFTDEGDGGTMNAIGRGHQNRSYVR